MYDDKVREFVKNIGIENIGKRLVNSRDGAVSHPAVSQCSTSPLLMSLCEIFGCSMIFMLGHCHEAKAEEGDCRYVER